MQWVLSSANNSLFFQLLIAQNILGKNTTRMIDYILPPIWLKPTQLFF